MNIKKQKKFKKEIRLAEPELIQKEYEMWYELYAYY